MQADIVKKVDVLADMAGASPNVDQLKAEDRELSSEKGEYISDLTSLREAKEEEKYFRSSEKLLDENISASLEAKIKKQERSIRKLQKQIDDAVSNENNLHNRTLELKEEIQKSNEYIVVLTGRIASVKDSSTNNYFKNLLTEENSKVGMLSTSLNDLEKEYDSALENLNYLNLAMEEMTKKLNSERVKLQETKANLVNPASYIDEDLKERDEEEIKELQKKIAKLDKRRLEILTDPAIIASEAKELIITGDRVNALSKVQELVTIVKSKPYMDIPSSNELTTMLQEEEEAAIEARDEFASLIDTKEYLGSDSKVVEERINFLNGEISALEEKISMAREEIHTIDTVEFQSLTARLEETNAIYNQLLQELAEYKIIVETGNEDKTPKRRAILAAAYDRKQKEVENVRKIVENYKNDQKILIHKAYVLETQEIAKYESEIQKHKDEIVEMNCLLANVGSTKDVLAIENDKQKLKELDEAVKDIKHRQKYSQTPSEIYDEIEIYLGTMDDSVKKSIVETPREAVIESPGNPVVLEETTFSTPDLLIDDVMNELPDLPEEEDTTERLKVVNVEPVIEEVTSNEDNPFVIGEYTEDTIDTSNEGSEA